MARVTSGTDQAASLSEPRHAWVAHQVRQGVRDGTYPSGSRLPPEPELATRLSVSRGTLRHALRVLTAEGVLHTIAGRGTFVGDAVGARMSARGALVGMVLPSIVRARAPELVSGAEEVLREAGFSLVLATSGDDWTIEHAQVQRIVAQGVRGLILYTVDGRMDLTGVRALVHGGLPVVLIDRYIPDLAVDAVTMDNVAAAFLAVQHLATNGYVRIGYVGTDNLGTSSIVERMAGYRWAVREIGQALDDDLVCSGIRRLLSWPIRLQDEGSARLNQEVLRRYLGRRGRPDAVFVCNDYVAFQVVEAAESLHLRIPDDLGVVGCDNVSYQDYYGVPLSTVEQPRHEIGATAATLLLDRLLGARTRVGRIAVAPRVIPRMSSEPAASGTVAAPIAAVAQVRSHVSK